MGIYYPKSRYPDEYNNDRFTQIVKQFKPFSGVLPKETNKAIQKIAECVKRLLIYEKIEIDVIIPVPGHAPKTVSSSLQKLTKIISDSLEVENGTNLIERIELIPDHNKSDDVNRLAHKQYCTIKVSTLIYGKSVLLIDDILTSGNTIAACIKKLKDNGAEKIYVLTIGRTKSEW